MERPEDQPTREAHLSRWLAAGRPAWIDRDAMGEKWSYLVVGEDGPMEYIYGAALTISDIDGDDPPDGRLIIGSVLYEEEHKGWSATWGEHRELMEPDGELVALFDTREEAQAALIAAAPRMIDDDLLGIAQSTVESINKECGFFRDILLPADDEAADWLVSRFWESGGFDINE